MRITILGSGSSSGVPIPGLGWGNCDPNNPKNERLRPSILIETQGKTILVDTSPDLRTQLLNASVSRIDAIIYTHGHADHLHGIDDLRAINRAMSSPIPVFADALTLKQIETRFAYALAPLPDEARDFYFKPTLTAHEVVAGSTFDVCGVSVTCFDQDHGRSRTLGLRVGDFAYTTDLVNLPEDGFDALTGIDTWVIGVYTDHPHPTHLHVEKALQWVERVEPRHTILTHMGPDLDHQMLQNSLPNSVDAAFDGMQISLTDA